jgi:TRAP-type mannitol/chloroaromatic compound transport system permease small subunit
MREAQDLQDTREPRDLRDPRVPHPPRSPGAAVTAYCRAVDRLNEFIGWLVGPAIVFVSAAIVYEVISRGAFNVATSWVNESVIYGSSAVYLLVGGYALLHRRHVRIDLVLGMISPRAARVLDLVTLPFLAIYALALMIAGFDLAWSSFLQAEGTGSPWNPRIWPVKMCIPLAGLLVLLQALSNLFRDIGWAPPAGKAPEQGAL